MGEGERAFGIRWNGAENMGSVGGIGIFRMFWTGNEGVDVDDVDKELWGMFWALFWKGSMASDCGGSLCMGGGNVGGTGGVSHFFSWLLREAGGLHWWICENIIRNIIAWIEWKTYTISKIWRILNFNS